MHTDRIRQRRPRRNGQAMVELTLALVVILALTVALLQWVRLGRAHTEAMTEARRQAGLAALNRLAPSAPTAYIRDWRPGPDGVPLTPDDEAIADTPHGLSRRIVERAAADEDQWAVLQGAERTAIPALRGHPRPSSVFGLVRAAERRTIPLISAVQHLLYADDEIEIEAEVWMTHTDNIY